MPRPSVGPALMLYGIHPVSAAWTNPERQCRHLYGTPPALASFQPVLDRAKDMGLKRPATVVTDRDAIERMLPPGAVHQGLALDSEPLPEVGLEDVLIAAGDGPAALVLLDQVTDPHNVGAIMRSAAALGAKGVIVQSRHAPEITGVLAKSASGAVEVVPLSARPICRARSSSCAMRVSMSPGWTRPGRCRWRMPRSGSGSCWRWAPRARV